MIMHHDDCESVHTKQGERFEHHRRQLSVYGKQLGCSMYRVPPGKTAWPAHHHLANEEAIYILEGHGALTINATTHSVRAGHYIALTVGQTHQLLNSSDTETMLYLCFSTMKEPDITIYPDSNKIGIFAGSAPGGDKTSRTLSTFLDMTGTMAYWEGEQDE